MSRLKEKYSESTPPLIAGHCPRMPGRTVEVDLHMSSDLDELPNLLKTCIVYCNKANQEPLQICAYYCTVLISFFASLLGPLRQILVDSGAKVRVINAASLRQERGMEIVAGDDQSVNLCYLGQAVFLLYKDTSSETDMRDQTNELQIHAGVPPNARVSIAFNQTAASTIRSMLGNNHSMRKLVLGTLVDISYINNPLGYVCCSLRKNLSWMEMESLVCISDTLLVTNSPVLRDIRIAGEVEKLAEAFKKVNACAMPQFFAILESPRKTCFMERSRFPTIIAVAEAIKRAYQNGNVNDTAARLATSPESALVSQLLQLHTTYINNDAHSISVELPE